MDSRITRSPLTGNKPSTHAERNPIACFSLRVDRDIKPFRQGAPSVLAGSDHRRNASGVGPNGNGPPTCFYMGVSSGENMMAELIRASTEAFLRDRSRGARRGRVKFSAPGVRLMLSQVRSALGASVMLALAGS
ncbi:MULTISPECIES: hypothetical protein [unclassified Mesorhizobium]|uniref:hypothetical protein n=1 Tax=unclassified Mesorhizobium TaxID=325217 RepID=UPI00112C1644|nr:MULTISPECIES: hypothetical protein [unclassified Mesorhizobium]TPL97066.1 hypothetical protein FJ939_27845 [Mesorhizobium sp. B2-3-8]TPM07620.1 hypothetical protein FJ940_28055 [Mesorhizobium sp. B2-3-7]TPM18230.1 hypothetical protein FJ953_16200 [Mesorhizobium sp. B2-3-6]TPM53816.1 hypothetical protein FJ951_02155 [Mesorhizobium sp. B2-2-3]TPN67987.1 hypothetical protein FJ986_08620 [Mesorhizobium sp. B1-1-1]